MNVREWGMAPAGPILLLLCLAAGAAAQGEEPAPGRLPEKGIDPDRSWRSAVLAGGVHLSLPPRYRAQADWEGRVEAVGLQGKMTPLTPYCLVRPFIAHRGESAGRYLQRAVLPRYKELPDAKVVRIAAPRPDRAAVLLRYAIGKISRYALVHCALQGRAGMSYYLPRR